MFILLPRNFPTETIKLYWHCCCLSLIGSRGRSKVFVEFRVPCQGYFQLLYSSWHDKLHYWNLWSPSAFARVVDNTALVCMAVYITGVGKRLHTLPSFPTWGEPLTFSWGTLTDKQWAHYTVYMVVAFPSLVKICGECSTIHSPPALFFNFFF